MPGTHTPTVSPSITDHTKKGTSSSVLLRLDTGVPWPLESPLNLHHQKSLAIKPGVSMYRYLCPAKEKADVKYWLVDPNSVTQQSDIRYLPAPLHSFWSLIFQTLRQRTLLFSYWKMCPIAIMKDTQTDLNSMQFQEHNHGFLVGLSASVRVKLVLSPL